MRISSHELDCDFVKAAQSVENIAKTPEAPVLVFMVD